MQTISISQLGAGNGTSAAIAEGKSFRITHRDQVVAILRPHRDSDKGRRSINATDLYNETSRFVNEAQAGKTVLVLRRGEPFATLCKYEEKKPKASKPRAKPVAKRAAKRRAKTATTRKSKVPTPQAETPTAADEPVPHRHHASVELLKLADMLPPGLEVELMTRGASLHKGGKLEKGLHLLELLDEGKLEEALSGLRLLMD